MTQEKKRISEKHTEIFLEFLVFWGKQIKEENKKTREENYLHGKTPNKQKKKREIFLGFLLILLLIKLERKARNKQEIFLDFLKVFQTHKKKARK